MKYTEFEEAYDFKNLLEKLSRQYINTFLTTNPELKIAGFGADCSIDNGDILMCVLTENGIKDVPNWLKKWEWIGEWDHWNFNEGFDEEEAYQEIKNKLDELAFSIEIEEFEELEKAILHSTVEVLTKLHKEFVELRNVKLVIRDHGDLQEESENRLKAFL